MEVEVDLTTVGYEDTVVDIGKTLLLGLGRLGELNDELSAIDVCGTRHEASQDKSAVSTGELSRRLMWLW